MFTEFHGLSENPFTIMPNPRLAWLGTGMRKLRAELCKAVLKGRSPVLLSGGPGVGKSLALTVLASDLRQSGAPCRIHALNCDPLVSATELLRRAAEDAAGDDAPASDRLTVLLIDEAQHFASAELGALLHATALCGDRLRLVLAGTPEFELRVNEAIAENPGMIATHWSLEPLPPDEISSYIAGRLEAAGGWREIFTADAIECLTRHSGGVPRSLNVLCSTALFLAWREGRQEVDASIVETAFNLRGSLTDATEPWSQPPTPTPTRLPPIEASILPEAKDVLMAELGSTALEASAASAALESTVPQTSPPEAAARRPEAAKLETCEYAIDVATPVSREIARLQPGAQPVAWQHRSVAVPIRAQVRRATLYLPMAGVAAIIFLFVAIDWRARIEQLVDHATALMTSPSLGPSAAQQELAERSSTPQHEDKMASSTEPVYPVPVYVDPQYAYEGPQTIEPGELAKLLARARRQIEAFALTTPAGDNALETLQRVLVAMPGQPDALQGIHDIASRYAVLATQAERRGEHGLAKRYVDKGLRLVPDHPDLLALQHRLR